MVCSFIRRNVLIAIVFCNGKFSMDGTIARYKRHTKDTRVGQPSVEDDIEVSFILLSQNLLCVSFCCLLDACPILYWENNECL